MLLKTTINLVIAAAAFVPTYAGAAETERPHGAAENAWRYQFYNGRWWYWTPHDQWSFYDGRRWVARSSAPRETAAEQHPNPTAAPLTNRLPLRTYSNFGASPFYSPLGQAAPGLQPVAPATPLGSSGRAPRPAGASELGISGSRSGDAGSGVGGGSVGGANITSGLGQPSRP